MKVVEGVQQLLGWCKERKRAYQLAFRSPAGAEVLVDLARFCRANESTFHEDARIHALAEGRREVWLRIQEWLDLTPEELTAIKSGNRIQLLKPGQATENDDNA